MQLKQRRRSSQHFEHLRGPTVVHPDSEDRARGPKRRRRGGVSVRPLVKRARDQAHLKFTTDLMAYESHPENC